MPSVRAMGSSSIHKMPHCPPINSQCVITTKASRQKLPTNVPYVPLDGVSFHFEDSVHKCKILGLSVVDDLVITYLFNEQLAIELIGGTVHLWPSDGQQPIISLRMKYAIMHKIGSAINVGEIVFCHLLCHMDSFGINIPICFPRLLTAAFLLHYKKMDIL
ncbi:uncharacterized protein E5676_scaffold232G00030 [Cucumis melo var. makuwa]|uniref:Uncharacterized protein n=1 Tax=Cucumis melo var. makuwa TaxID=1194695 RepID=A0A5D3BEY2_CUCMM|nr:uncharacterized protein E5676_scaffold232G00030 [Cucumis melo var. makuwa]